MSMLSMALSSLSLMVACMIGIQNAHLLKEEPQTRLLLCVGLQLPVVGTGTETAASSSSHTVDDVNLA